MESQTDSNLNPNSTINTLPADAMIKKIQLIVSNLKSEYREAKVSHDEEWVDECHWRLSQMHYVCKELGIDYGEKILQPTMLR